MWDLIESVPDHCLSFYFSPSKVTFLHFVTGCVMLLQLF